MTSFSIPVNTDRLAKYLIIQLKFAAPLHFSVKSDVTEVSLWPERELTAQSKNIWNTQIGVSLEKFDHKRSHDRSSFLRPTFLSLATKRTEMASHHLHSEYKINSDISTSPKYAVKKKKKSNLNMILAFGIC